MQAGIGGRQHEQHQVRRSELFAGVSGFRFGKLKLLECILLARRQKPPKKCAQTLKITLVGVKTNLCTWQLHLSKPHDHNYPVGFTLCSHSLSLFALLICELPASTCGTPRSWAPFGFRPLRANARASLLISNCPWLTGSVE